ncbi:MAG: CHAT domain-containing protein [Nitrospira sp.]|nr:CHAT domain-containing protein [Nitrospira sp.]
MATVLEPPTSYDTLLPPSFHTSASYVIPDIKTMTLLAVFFVCIVAAGQAWATDALAQATVSPEKLMEQGQSAYQQGAFTQAMQYWTEAGRRYERDGKTREQIKAQVNLTQALYQTGHYKEAGSLLVDSGKQADRIGDPLFKAIVQGRLGSVLFALGENKEALRAIEEGLASARALDNSALAATMLNDQGNILTADERYSSAVAAYTESSILAKASHQPSLTTIALINAGRATIQEGALDTAKARLDIAAQEIASMPDSFDKANAWLSLGDAYEEIVRPRIGDVSSRNVVQRTLLAAKSSRGVELQPGTPPTQGPAATTPPLDTQPSQKKPSPLPAPLEKKGDIGEPVLRQAADAYWNAIQIATKIGDSRNESYGWGYLGHLYEMQHRTDEALDLTRRAILAAQQVTSPESLYRWHWQTARLLRSKGQINEAMAAYQRAIETLQPIRSEFMVGGQNRRFSFRETTGNLFFELSDLLLQRASSTPDLAARQHLLGQAQDTVERYKAAELQDYFRDECVATARSTSTAVAQESKSTAIVYPIILADRMELLVSMPDGLKQFIVPVTGEQLTEEIRAFRLGLEDRSNNAYRSHAQTLYQWLIRPMEADLTNAHITTLVFVPDGPLRTIPMGPLHDGSKFLIERYAVATTPGLTLTDPRPLNRKQIRFFSMGLTEAVQGFPALPYVGNELKAVQAIYGGKQVLNEEFRAGKVEHDLNEQPYNMIHIASHGKVESDVTKSFVLTFDDRITMDRLSHLVGLFEMRTVPLELLTLSACETAAGDDRAALGLAGMAIKAGAKSALATLWFIDDEATAELITEFYKNLQDPVISKAMALQQAQLTLLKNPERAHPGLWAPFLLINNWL